MVEDRMWRFRCKRRVPDTPAAPDLPRPAKAGEEEAPKRKKLLSHLFDCFVKKEGVPKEEEPWAQRKRFWFLRKLMRKLVPRSSRDSPLDEAVTLISYTRQSYLMPDQYRERGCPNPTKTTTDCSAPCARQDGGKPDSLHFGVQPSVLTSEANPVPKVVELLLMYVEQNGLHNEGIYRQSGPASQAKELHQILETDPEGPCLDDYQIDTITGLVKQWLREMPDPLMTFDLYSDFLRAVELPEEAERIRAVYQKLDELPPANFNTLERLISHLVRVAKEEESNKMSPRSLGIVFAPNILRSPDTDDPFVALQDVYKTAQCVEILISEQLRRYNEKMQNIQELEYTEALAVSRLELRRQN